MGIFIPSLAFEAVSGTGEALKRCLLTELIRLIWLLVLLVFNSDTLYTLIPLHLTLNMCDTLTMVFKLS